MDPRDHPVTSARGAQQNAGLRMFHLLQKVKELPGPISADARSQLTASDDQGTEPGEPDISEVFKHVPFAGFLCHRADVARLRTIARAFESGMAHINVPPGPSHRIRE